MSHKSRAILYFLLGENLKQDFLPIVEKHLGVKLYTDDIDMDKINMNIDTLIHTVAAKVDSDILSHFYVNFRNMLVMTSRERYEDIVPKPLLTENVKSRYFFIHLIPKKYKDILKIKWKYENFDLESIHIFNKEKNNYITYYKINKEWYVYIEDSKKIDYIKKRDFIYFDKIKFETDYDIMLIYKKQRNDKQDYINYKCICDEIYGWENEDFDDIGGICWFVVTMMILLLHPDMRKISLEKLQKKSNMDVSKLFACKETKTTSEIKEFYYSISRGLNDFSPRNITPLLNILRIIEESPYIDYLYIRKNAIQKIIKPPENTKLMTVCVYKDGGSNYPIYETIYKYTLMGILTRTSIYNNKDDTIETYKNHAIGLIRCSDEQWYIYDDNIGYSLTKIPTHVENNIITFKRKQFYTCSYGECRISDNILTSFMILFYLKN